MITVVLSAFNEINNAIFWNNVRELDGHCQLIVVDGGSSDGTQARLCELGVPYLLAENSNRGKRFNLGISQSTGQIILLVHPRSLIHHTTLLSLEKFNGKRRLWGAFTHSFDDDHLLFQFTSWYSNFVRGDLRGIYYLDHCLFFSEDLKDQALFPEDTEIFEDTIFCRNLRKLSKPIRLPNKVVTSSIRFRRNGLLRQAVLNQVLKVMFFCGASQHSMNKAYEKGLSLNMKK